ncbi:histidine-type phosphatase [Streptomyces sp. NPDC087850]|uniref:histidine-type phosphatase n=1 Tax=Streptomyces sp. NPDC087850 TaxID=3365809 RepID=UPI0037F343D3
MRRVTAPVAIALALSALLPGAGAAQASGKGEGKEGGGYYATKTPYRPLESARGYQRVPQGFVPVFTENVSRHGSRAATDSADGDLILGVWRRAESEGRLTRLGAGFGGEVRGLLDAMEKVGYGNLSARGKQEIRDTADRLRERLPGLFDRMSENSERIDVVSSGKGRAVDSGTNFVDALVASDPKLGPLVDPARTDADLLYFHKSAGGAAYRDYIENDARLATTLKKIREQPRTFTAARNVLRKIFTPAFVDGMDPADQVDAARSVYDLYSIAPSMRAEGDWQLGRYIDAKDAVWFAYLDDAESFYENGPGFKGDDITYRMADVLLDDFFRQIEEKKSGKSKFGAVLRFTHAEEIMPLAALMKLPGSEEQATESAPYTYANNSWRGSSVAPMAANIQWDVFRNGRGDYLVRMLYNEKQTAFKDGCRPVSKNSYFYGLGELERCFGRK